MVIFADSHNILNRWKNYSCQVLHAHGINDVRQAAEPLIPDPSPFKAETATEKI
jgi:hypothetical protein